MCGTVFADRQARRDWRCPGATARMGRSSGATLGSKPIVGFSASGWKNHIDGKIPFKRSGNPHLVADGIANGLRPWFTKFSGTLHDEPLAQSGEDIYGRHIYGKNICATKRQSLGSPCYIPSKPPGFMAKTAFARKVEDPTLAGSGLIEAARSFLKWSTTGCWTPRTSANSKPDSSHTAALSEEQCAQLRQFVQSGRRPRASFETSLYDQWGQSATTLGWRICSECDFEARRRAHA